MTDLEFLHQTRNFDPCRLCRAKIWRITKTEQPNFDSHYLCAACYPSTVEARNLLRGRLEAERVELIRYVLNQKHFNQGRIKQ
jgi:hypothetical protein